MLAWAPPHHLSLSSEFPLCLLGCGHCHLCPRAPWDTHFPSGASCAVRHKGPKGEHRTSDNSHSKSCDHYKYSSPSQRALAGLLSKHSAGSSSSELKEITMSFSLAFSDGQEKKVSAFPFSLSALPQHLPSEPHVPQSAPMKKSRSPSF